MQIINADVVNKSSGRRLILSVLLICFVAAASACSRGGKISLNSMARIEQKITRQAVKDAQVETIKQELEKQPELTDSEKASALQAVKNSPLADTDTEQASNLLQALSDFLANEPSLESLAKWQKALLGVSVAFSAKLAKEALLAGSTAEEATAMQQTLMDQAFRFLLKNGMSSAEIVLLAAKELSALPDASVAVVEKLLELPSLEGVSELQRMLALEEGVATLRECVDPAEVREGKEYFCPNGSKRVGTLVASSAPTPLPVCTSDGQVNCAVPAAGSIKAADTTDLGAKVISTASVAGVTGTVVLPTTAQVQTGVAFGAASALTGALVAKLADCAADGDFNCTVPAAGSIKAANTTGLATKVVLGYTVAGESGAVRLPSADQVVSSVAYGALDRVTGTVILPTTVQVQTGVTFGAASALTGTLVAKLADCTADGDANCTVPAAGNLKAADTTVLAAKVISTASVAGVAGAVILPTAAQVQTGVTFGAASALTGSLVAKLADCAADGDFNCTVPAAGNLKAADTTGLAAKVISTASVAGVTGTVVLPTTAQVQTGVAFGAESALTGSLVAKLADCAADGETNCTVPAAGNLKAADTTGLSAKVISTATVAGVSGTVVLPTTAQVQTGVSFGAASTLTGTLVAKLPDCAADGDFNCSVPAAGSIKAADTANFDGWDIRKKRNASGTVLTFAGISGQNKTCRNRARLGLYNNTTAPADASGLVPDFFDTIDDYNNNTLGIPLDYPDWPIAGVLGSHGEDFACGGIYATGSVSNGFTGADGTLAHDPDGNWQDLTPGILPGGANSTNTNNGCNASDKHCVFKELISGLMVTEASAATHNWQNAINYCHNLGEAGGVITSPIPVIGGESYTDWRLPTQKEAVQLYNAGIRGLNQTANLRTNFGNVEDAFWSASSVSNGSTSAFAWGFYLFISNGATPKTNLLRVVCVR